ncbi:hypothetical protein D3C74_410370 [compost metagenome]
MYRTNFVRNTESSISRFLKSSIGPNTRKASSEPPEKVGKKAEATNASDVEQSDSRNAKPIMKR